MVSEQAERILYLEERRQSPTRVALARSREFRLPKQPPFNMDAVAETVREGRPLPLGERWPEIAQVLNSNLDNLWAGRERDAASVARRTQLAINRLLQEEPGL
jgi:hypothetical protein